MLPINHIYHDRSGSTLVVVVLVLMAVTVMGLAAINFSSVDVHLASNEKWQKTGFNNADIGIHGTLPLIALFHRGGTPPVGDPDNPDDDPCLIYLNGMDADTLGPFLVGDMVGGDSQCEDNQLKYKDISFRGCNLNVDIDICPSYAAQITGDGTEFGAGAEGVGNGGGANMKYYRITSTGDAAINGTKYTVFGKYGWTEKPGGIK